MPKAPKITVERLREVLDYNQETGIFTWKINTSKTDRIGHEAGSIAANGYRYIKIDRGEYTGQKLVWMYMIGTEPTKRLSFRDGNKNNLKWENIFEWGRATKSEFDHSTPEGRAAYGRAWRNDPKNAEKYKSKSLQQDFGITIEQYNQMLLSQKGCCSICEQPETATRNGKIKALAVDHCHQTGAIRSLLCTKCNVALGAVNDSDELLNKMIAYLEKHRQQNSNIVSLKQRS